MHGHVSKRVKMQRKPMGGTNKHDKHIFVRSEKGERYAWSNWHHGDASQVFTSKKGFVGVGYSYITTNSLRVSNMAKPRAREVNTTVKYESKQT